MNKIKFDKYFQGEWPYETHAGVGIKLSGIPNNQEKFISILQSESCNPLATRRILAQIIEKGFYLTTCVSTLNFNYIGDCLKEINVKMEIIPPIENPTDGSVDMNALQIFKGKSIDTIYFKNEQEKKETLDRLAIFNKHLEEMSNDLGAYKNFN